MAEVIESLCASKTGDDALNEDSYVVTESLIGVFDGETDKSRAGTSASGSPVSGSPTPGRLAARALAEATKAIASFDAGAFDADVLVKHLHAALQVDSESPEQVAVGALLHIPTRTIIRVGDITVGINGVFDIPRKKIDDTAASARAALLEAHLAAGAKVAELQETDPGREMILPLLRMSGCWRNREGSPYSFAAFDGHGTPASLVEIFEAPKGSEVVLATDGYLDPKPTLADSERVLAKSLEVDPLQLGPPPGTKAVLSQNCSFDDRTYVRIQL